MVERSGPASSGNDLEEPSQQDNPSPMASPSGSEDLVQARLRLLEMANVSDASLDEVIRMTLDEIEAQTGSSIGFYHFLEDDQETISLQEWSTNTTRNMCTAEGKGTHYSISEAGVWVDCVRERRPVIHNDYESLPHRKGLPSGHARIVRELLVPVLRGERIVAIIGVGNKPTEYDAADVETARLLGDLSWEIVKRKRAEEALLESERQYRLLFANMVDGFAHCRMLFDERGQPSDFVYLDVNSAFETLTGLQDVVGRKVTEVIPGIKESNPELFEIYGRTSRTGRPERFETEVGPLGIWFSVSVYRLQPNEFVAVFENITERKSAERKLQKENREMALANSILKLFVEETGDGLYEKALDIVLEGLESPYGVFGYVDEDGNLMCPTMSRLFDECEIEGKCICYTPDKWKGLWSRALLEKRTIYTNEPPPVPAGHESILRNLAAPIIFQGRAIGLLNLANKATDYTEDDREFIEAIANRIAPVLYAWIHKELREGERREAEQALHAAHDELEKRVQDRTKELSRVNAELDVEIAERKRAARKVKAERQRFYDVLEMLPVYVVLLTSDYKVPFANRFFRERFGESHGRRCYEYLFDRCEPCEVCETYTVMKTKGPHEWEWTGPDGRNYDIFDFPFTESDGSRLILEMGIDVTERNKAEEALLSYQEALRSLASQLSLAEERERRRIATYLHDSVVQTLGMLKNRMAEAAQEAGDEAAPDLSELKGLADEAIRDARSLTFELSPPILYELGLEAAVEWLVEQTGQRYGLEAVCGNDDRPKPLDENMVVTVFQAVRELLVNAAKHARATRVDVDMGRDGGHLVITVRDNGRGFDTALLQELPKDTGGFGLFNIRERLSSAGGRLDVSSLPGQGTTVILEAPLLEPEGDEREGGAGDGRETAPS